MQGLEAAMGGRALTDNHGTVSLVDLQTTNRDGAKTIQRVTFKTLGKERVRIEARTAQGQSALVTSGGRASVEADGDKRPYPRRALGAIRVPHLPLLSILSDFRDDRIKIEYHGVQEARHGGFHHVRIHPLQYGWVKMRQHINGVEVHYVRNTRTGAVDDFKFKD